MAIESASYISQLDITNPKGTDQYSTVDDQIRLCKKVVKQSFPNLDSEMSASSGALNQLIGIQSNVQDQIDANTSAITTLSASMNTDLRGLSSSLQTQIVLASGNLDTKIETLSATLNTQMNSLSSSLVASIAETSAALNTDIHGLSASLNANKLDVSATATNSILWDGSQKYQQTATPSLGANAIWFQPSYTP